jgi:hypothetical protein
MKSFLSRYWRIACCLCVIFASGSGIGYLYGKRQANAVTVITTTETAAAAGAWKASALAKLNAQLDLTPQQVESVTGVLEQTEQSIAQNRERALLQMHLQVLKAHDGFAPYLNPTQMARLQQMREELKRRILQRFANLLTEPEKSLLSMHQL